MAIMKVTSSGQISLPADVRRRWDVTRVRLVDLGDRVTIEPVPDDVFDATFGAFTSSEGTTSEQWRAAEREADAEREQRRHPGLRRGASRGGPAR